MTVTKNRHSRWRLSWLVAAVMIGAAPGRAADGTQIKPHDDAWSAPEDANATRAPVAKRLEGAAGGRKLFRQRCAMCHGEDGRGTSRAPDLMQPHVQTQTDGALFWKLTSGNAYRGMPSFSYLPDTQRWQLIEHLRGVSAGLTP